MIISAIALHNWWKCVYIGGLCQPKRGVISAHEAGYLCHESIFKVQKEHYARLIILIMLTISIIQCINKALYIIRKGCVVVSFPATLDAF